MRLARLRDGAVQLVLRGRALLSRHRTVASVAVLLGIAVVLSLKPSSQICQIGKETHQEYCSFHNALAVLAFKLSALLIDFEAVAVGLGTIAIASFTYTLWRSTDKLWKAGERQLETVVQTQRAFVFAQGFYSTPNVDKKFNVTEYLIAVDWKNTGLTPALDAHSGIAGHMVPLAQTTPPWFGQSIAGGPTIVLGPSREMGPPSLHIPLDPIVHVWRGRLRIYVWARVEYRDVFSKAIHFQEQCAELNVLGDPTRLPPKGAGPRIGFTITGPQNRTD